MDTNVPYMPSVGNLPKILDAIQKAGVPETFGLDFLRDLGFTSSNDRPVIKVLKYLRMLDGSGKPLSSYREFVDHTKARGVLAEQLKIAYDDLFVSDKEAPSKSVASLKGWFKTKTGAAESVADKTASTFKALASYADFSAIREAEENNASGRQSDTAGNDRNIEIEGDSHGATAINNQFRGHSQFSNNHPPGIGLVYRLEIHLPDTQNVDTFRAIFKALREELMP